MKFNLICDESGTSRRYLVGGGLTLPSMNHEALGKEPAANAPAYLRPSAQLKLLHTAADCLAVLELAVNWEAEKLYGVEGLGPLDEF